MGQGGWFFLQLLVQGLAIGSVYSLVALGFVLIYKARASSISPRESCSCSGPTSAWP